MNYFPKTSYWRPLVPNDDRVYKTNNPYLKNPLISSVAENETDFVLVKRNFSIYFIIPMFTANYKYIKKFASEISKCTRSGKPDV